MKISHFFIFIILNIIILYIDYFELKNIVIIYYLLFIIYFYKIQKHKKNSFFSKFNTFKTVFIIVLFSVSYFLFYNLLSNKIQQSTLIGFRNLSEYEIIKIIILIPILEELVFRKYLLTLLVENLSQKKAIIILSFGFTLVHIFSNSGLLNVFFISIVYSLIYLKTRNIYLCFLSHILNNFLVIFLLPYLILNTANQSLLLNIILISSFSLVVYTLYMINKLKN